MLFRSSVMRWSFTVGILLLSLIPSHAEVSLDALAGTWSGSGSMKPFDGNRERVRCKVAYNVKKPDRSLSLDLRCASEAYKMVLSASIEQSGAQLSGNWFESEYRQGGKISGTTKDGLI